MNDTFSSAVIMLCLYRIASLLVGVGFGYMGFRLFYHGVFDKAGELQAVWGEKRLLLKQAAPGTFFALFGTTIVVVTLLKGIGLDIEVNGNRLSSSTSERMEPIKTSSALNKKDELAETDQSPDTSLPPETQGSSSGSSVVAPGPFQRLKADLSPQ